VRQGDVDEAGNVSPRRAFASEQPNLLKRVGRPREQDEQGDADCSNWIQVPDEMVAHNGHDEPEDVDDNVVAMVHKEDFHGWESPVKVAIDHQGGLRENCSNLISQSLDHR